MTAPALGIKNLKLVLAVSLALAAAGCIALEDGKIGYGDVGTLLGVVPALSGVAEVNFQEGLAELKDLTPEESAELSAFVAVKFSVPQKNVEAGIEELVAIAAAQHALIARAGVAFQKLIG